MPLIAAVYGIHSTYAIPLVVACIALAVAALREQPLRQLLVTWFGGLLFGLSVAGEKCRGLRPSGVAADPAGGPDRSGLRSAPSRDNWRPRAADRHRPRLPC